MNSAKCSLLFNLIFVVLLGLLHIIKTDIDPSWRFISEYAIGKYGWLMQLAFLSLAISNVATWLAIRDALTSFWGRVGSVLFLVGTLGLLLAAIFVTDPINAPPEARTTSGNLHNIGGGLGLFGFIGTLIFSRRLLVSPEWKSSRAAVWIATAIVILGFLISFISITVIAAQHDGKFGPDTPVGWPNRIGILSGCVWLAIVAWKAKSDQRR